jgi:xylulokinase
MIVQLHDYLLRAFGAETYVTPETDAGMTGFFDVDRYVWDRDYLKLFDIDRKMLPDVSAVSTPIGTISDKIADEVGLPRGLALYTGIGDVSSAAVGSGIVHAGDLLVSMGTGGMLVYCADSPMRDPNGAFLITDHAIHGLWQWEGIQKGSAGCYRWYRDVIATDERDAATAAGKDIYEVLNEKVKGIPPGSNGILVLPYFASAGCPRNDPYARGCILGLTFAHGKYEIARAFMEGVALEYKDMLQSLNQSGLSPGVVHVSGGSAKSDVWNQIQADLYDRPVETLAFPDASVLGAAITASVGAGVFSDIYEAVDALIKPGKRYEPDPKNAEKYRDVYKAYTQAYEGLSERTFRSLSNL